MAWREIERLATAMREKIKPVDEKMIREVPNALKEVPGAVLRAEDPKWEYKTVIAAHDVSQTILNRLGAEGWELVSVTAQPGDRAAYYLKHRK